MPLPSNREQYLNRWLKAQSIYHPSKEITQQQQEARGTEQIPGPKYCPITLIRKHLQTSKMPRFQAPRYTRTTTNPYPRSLADLQAERTYLLSTLQAENSQATNLLRRVAPLEETLSLPQETGIRRSAKKQLGWLKHQIKEATRQEKAILAQLGQVSHEIQSRERWNQIESERQQHLQALNSLNVQSIYEGGQPMQFNPLSPEFRPHGVLVPKWIPHNPIQSQWDPYSDTSTSNSNTHSTNASQGLELDSEEGDIVQPLRENGFIHNQSAGRDPAARRTSWCPPGLLPVEERSKIRRHSTGGSANQETPSPCDRWACHIHEEDMDKVNRGSKGRNGAGYFDLPLPGGG